MRTWPCSLALAALLALKYMTSSVSADAFNSEASTDGGEADKRQYMRFGRSDADDSNQVAQYLRFGRTEPARRNDPFLRFGKRGEPFLRFGKGGEPFLRFGKGGEPFLRFGKRGEPFLRFGKRGEPFLRFGKRGEPFLRFGKSDPDYLIFGKRGQEEDIEATPDRQTRRDVILRFGRGEPFLRFGKGEPFLRFGKGEPFLRFGKGDDFLKFGMKGTDETDDDPGDLLPIEDNSSASDEPLRRRRDVSIDAENQPITGADKRTYMRFGRNSPEVDDQKDGGQKLSVDTEGDVNKRDQYMRFGKSSGSAFAPSSDQSTSLNPQELMKQQGYMGFGRAGGI
ncbi:hypothetical protein EGW08_008234 [Elysia chlorotica]|uniref:FMRFamide neuropeptide n=1 Tax=Elysia chlorotica TaxID=188477 RepID=A0A3S1BM32_ELYCH|nr:hypothetical protein EGW08_008234 [Elysia chlorotica]